MSQEAIRGHIRSVIIKGLFGRYDYVVPDFSKSCNGPQRLVLLYGDNGCGKTTVLKLIYHALACEPKAGHRTFLSRTKFSSLEIQLGDGTTVSARKLSDNLLGNFVISVSKPGGMVSECTFETSPDRQISPHERDPAEFQAFIESLAKLDLSLYFLTDTRTIMVSSPQLKRRLRGDTSDDEILYESRLTTQRAGAPLDPEQLARDLLKRSVLRLESHLMNWSMTLAARSEANVNVLYQEIIKRILVTPTAPAGVAHSREGLTQRLRALNELSASFARFGLLPQFNANDFLDYVAEFPQGKLEVLSNVLGPYLDALESRYKTLSDLQTRMELFVDTLNSFYDSKSVQIDARRGLSIQSSHQDHLAPEDLSSGERQLLLLFCTTMITIARPSVVFIDEPELSLNIKWQRSLLPSLLQFIAAAPVQFLFATHSFEILSKFMEYVVKLGVSK